MADAKQLIDAAERPLLAASVLAVLVYLGELAGVWTAWGVAEPVHLLALGLDVAFLIDLGAKLMVERRDYVRGPWFVVDLVCALPILATVGAPPALEGLRFVRMFRLLRALRLLRSLRTLRLLRLFDYTVGETLETRRFDAVLRVSVLAYAATFVALVQVARERVTAPAFGADELELWFVFGSLLGMALLLLLSQYQIPAVFSRQVRALLNVALPHQVADWFLAHPDAYDQDTRGPATVVFCDIRGFTAAAERLEIDALKRHLEGALDAVVDAHVAHDLIVDKFIGDAVMSFRGGNLVVGDPAEHAWRVVRAALDGQLALRRRADPYFQEAKFGVASGDQLLIGTFGASRRLSYTILGDRVNLASRLEGACNALGVGSLVCGDTRRLVGDRPSLQWRRVGRLRVSGKQEAIEAWEVFDGEVALPFLEPFHAGLAALEAGALEAARAQFAEADRLRPGGDALSRRYAAHPGGDPVLEPLK